MKLLLLHGPAINSSRLKLLEIKKIFAPSEVIVFDEKATSEEVLGNLATLPMLSEGRMVVWENPPKSASLDIPDSPSATFVLWFDHELLASEPIFKWLKEYKARILFFPEEKEISIFPLLDLLAHKDQKAHLYIQKLKKNSLSSTRREFDVYYLITMILYMLRSILVIPKKSPPFIKDKLTRQRANFKDSSFKNLYRFVLEIDYKLKSGLMEENQAEFLLINLFNEKF